VQVEAVPEVKVAGAQVRETRVVLAALRPTDRVCEKPFSVAVMTAVSALETVPAAAAKVVPMDPTGTTALAGTTRSGVLLERATAAPPVDAA
jgi:hypothetical protein